MRRTNALQRMLEGMTGTFNDGQETDVQFDDGCYADIDGEYVAVAPNVKSWLGRDLSGPEELRVIVDSLSHEIEHIRETDLRAKKDVMDYYEVENRDGYSTDNLPLSRNFSYRTVEAKVAGQVYNILEDQYIDWNRTERFRGLRKSHAFFVETQMNGRRQSKINGQPTPKALTSGLFQTALAGTAKGIAEADSEVQEFLAWARPHIEECRYNHDQDERLAIAKRVTDALIERLPEDADADSLEDLFDKLPIEGDADLEDVEGGDFDVEAAEASLDLPDAPPADAESDEGEDGDTSGDGDGEDGDETDEGEGEAESDELGDGEGDGSGEGGDMDVESLYDEADDDANITVEESDGKNDEDGGASSSGIGNANPSPVSKDADDGADDSETDDEGEFDFDNVLATMVDADETGNSREWTGVAEDASLAASDADERKYEQIRDEVAKDQTPIEKEKRERDERSEEMKGKAAHEYTSAETVRDYMNQTGLAAEVRRAFRKLATQDDEYTSDDGHAIDIRNAIEHMSGNYGEDELYVDEHEAAHGGRLVGATVDMSGSMSAFEKEAKAALGALNLATHEIGDEFCANTFFSYSGNAHMKNPKTKLITAPDESFEWDHLNSFTAESLDPMALGIQKLTAMMDNHQARQKVVFVVADGKPNLMTNGTRYSTGAVREANTAVNKAREDGYVVIGLGIGNVSKANMQEIFGDTGDDTDGYLMADSASLAQDLVETYKNQLGVEAVEY